MKDKITREEVAKRMLNDWKFNRYNHGGSRSYIDGQSGDRQLIIDTYYDSTFAEYMDDCAKRYFALEESMQYTLSEYKTMEELFNHAKLDEHSLYFIEVKISPDNVEHYSFLFTGFANGNYCEVYNNSYETAADLSTIHSFNIIKKLHTNEYKNI